MVDIVTVIFFIIYGVGTIFLFIKYLRSHRLFFRLIDWLMMIIGLLVATIGVPAISFAIRGKSSGRGPAIQSTLDGTIVLFLIFSFILAHIAIKKAKSEGRRPFVPVLLAVILAFFSSPILHMITAIVFGFILSSIVRIFHLV